MHQVAKQIHDDLCGLFIGAQCLTSEGAESLQRPLSKQSSLFIIDIAKKN